MVTISIIISMATISMINPMIVPRSPSEVDSLDSELVARTLASIENEEGEVFIFIFIFVFIFQASSSPFLLQSLYSFGLITLITHHDVHQVGYEMAIMDYETGMNHSPQVSVLLSATARKEVEDVLDIDNEDIC